MNKKVVFSGIQPSGNLHIGNYIGALQQWVKLQSADEYELIFCIVDLHAITVPQEPKVLHEKNLELAALYIACGIDPEKSKIFIQSENSDHSYGAWLFDCITPMGWLNRMIQYKDKSAKQAENTTVGLFNYPVLMALDILLYDTNLVPVGEDQKQHIELTRDLAEKFNNTFCHPKVGTGRDLSLQDNHVCLFTLPQPMIDKEAARIMSLQNPEAKMSKSDKDPTGTINLLEDLESVRNKIKRAMTDSGTEVKMRADKPAISNLLAIYSKLAGKTVAELESQYAGKNYGEFKADLAEIVASSLQKIQRRYKEIRADEGYLNTVLDTGRNFAIERSSKKVKQMKELMGLGR